MFVVVLALRGRRLFCCLRYSSEKVLYIVMDCAQGGELLGIVNKVLFYLTGCLDLDFIGTETILELLPIAASQKKGLGEAEATFSQLIKDLNTLKLSNKGFLSTSLE